MRYHPFHIHLVYMILILTQRQISKHRVHPLQIIQGEADCALDLLWIKLVSCLFFVKSDSKCFRQKYETLYDTFGKEYFFFSILLYHICIFIYKTLLCYVILLMLFRTTEDQQLILFV